MCVLAAQAAHRKVAVVAAAWREFFAKPGAEGPDDAQSILVGKSKDRELGSGVETQ